MICIVLLSGEIAAGKSQIAKVLEIQYAFRRVSTGEYLRAVVDHRNLGLDRDALKTAGDTLDGETGGKWVADLALQQRQQCRGIDNWLLDSVRRDFQIPWFRRVFDVALHVHLSASEAVRRRRYEERRARGGEYSAATSFEEAATGPTEAHVRSLGKICDLLVDTEQAYPEAAARRILARLEELQKSILPGSI